MKAMIAICDLLIVGLFTFIVWGITATIMAAITINLMQLNAAMATSIVAATVAAAGFVAFWIKGRFVSKQESLTEVHQVVPDFEVLHSYCTLFADLDTSKHIYDQGLLPHPKERILNAAIRILEREDSPELMRTAAVLVTELSQFQDGVGSTPQPTLTSVLLDTTDGTDGVDQHARAVASHRKSDIEIRANMEKEEIHSLVTNALRNAS